MEQIAKPAYVAGLFVHEEEAMDIPVSSTLGFIGIILSGFGLFLVLAGLDIFTIKQVSVKKGPKTWGLGIGIVILGVAFLLPEISINPSNTTNSLVVLETQVDFTPESIIEPTETTELTATVESTNDEIGSQEENDYQDGTNSDSIWEPITFKIPNDGNWTQPDESSYSAEGGGFDTFAWSEEIVEGDFTLKLKSQFGEALVVIYGDGQAWSNGCLIFHVNPYNQGIRIDTIYGGEEIWLDYKERKLAKKMRALKIEIVEDTAKLFADDILVASATIPLKAKTTGKIGLAKYWDSERITYSNILLMEH